MKQAADKSTAELDLGDVPRRPGRPVTGKAMTNAERQKAYRERQRELRMASAEPGLSGALSLWEETARNLGAANGRIRELQGQLVQQREELCDQVAKYREECRLLQEQLKRGGTKVRRHRDDPPIALRDDPVDDPVQLREALESLAERQLRLEEEHRSHFLRANQAEERVKELEALLASRNEYLQMALDQHRMAVDRGDRLQEKLTQRNKKGAKS